MSWGEKNYGPCDKSHLREFRTLEECGHDRTHDTPWDHRNDEVTRLPKGHARHVWSAKPRLVVKDELRQAKVMLVRGDWDAQGQGLDTPRWTGTRVTPRVMPSQDGQGVRSMCSKMARAEFYGPRWHRKLRVRGGQSEVDWAELNKVMRELES